jgi:amino acid transporter
MQTEETKNADRSGPMGIVASVALASVFGWVYLVALTSAVTDDIPYLLDAGNDAGGYAVAQALYDAFRRRFGSGVGGIVCMGIVAVAVFICGSTNVTSDSRSRSFKLTSKYASRHTRVLKAVLHMRAGWRMPSPGTGRCRSRVSGTG